MVSRQDEWVPGSPESGEPCPAGAKLPEGVSMGVPPDARDPAYPSLERREREERVSSLALRYRSGERAVLGELYAELEPLVHFFLRPHLSASRPLPLGVEAEDLYQQAYVALAEAALDWEPHRLDSFVPYFAGSFPWRIHRYLRKQTPWRRTARFQLRSMPHDVLMEQVADVAGADGRDWDDVLACTELLAELPKPYHRVIRLYLYHGLSFAEVGRAVGISRSAAHEAFGRALSLLRSSVAGPVAADPRQGGVRSAARSEDSVYPALVRRCVEAMHRLAPEGAPLPGRDLLCRAAGVTPREYRQVAEMLRVAGCLVGRRRGSAGSLACASAADTLRKLEGMARGGRSA